MNDRLTEEQFYSLSPAGERAAMQAGLAPEGIDPYEGEPTQLGDVLSVITDYVLDSLPETGRLTANTSVTLEEAVEAFEGGEKVNDYTAKFQEEDTTVTVRYVNDGNGTRRALFQIKTGGQTTSVQVESSYDDMSGMPEDLRTLLGALTGRGISVEMIGMMG